MNETSLQFLLQRNTELPKTTRYSILRQTAEALDTAHRRNSIHGNLSPASILIREEGMPGSPDTRITFASLKDFGTKLDLDKEIAGANTVPESAHYASPERILGIDLEPRSDQFSFAVIAYEALCLRRPFEAGEVSRLFFQICSEPQQAIHQLDPTLTPAVSAVFERALAKERDQRFATNLEFIAALGRALIHCPGWEGIELPTATSRPIAPPPPPPPRRTTDYELPPLNRRRAIDDDPAISQDRPWTQRIAWIAAACLLLAGCAMFLLKSKPTPQVPVQVLDTRVGPTTPPPRDESPPPSSGSSQPANVPANATPQSADTGSPSPPPTTTLQPHEPVNPIKRPAVTAKPPPRPPQSADSRQVFEGSLANVDLLTQPPGAKIIVDNNAASACTAPCTLQLKNGRHTLIATLPDFTLAQRVFNIPDESTLYIPLEKRTGALVVTSTPSSATILVDGKDAGLTPATLHLSPGPHNVTLVNGSQRYQTTVNVEADGIQATGYSFPPR